MDLGDVVALGGIAGLGFMTLRWAMGRSGGETDYSIADTRSSAVDLTRKLKRKINESSIKALGLDCEWVPWSGQQEVSLLQLATPDGFCALFRLVKLRGELPLELLELLKDRTILKVGFEVKNKDAEKLWVDYRILVNGCLDLRYLAEPAGLNGRGLASITKELFGVDLDKNDTDKFSNWNAPKLSDSQIKYACEDARYSYKIFEELSKRVPRSEWGDLIDELYRARSPYKYRQPQAFSYR